MNRTDRQSVRTVIRSILGDKAKIKISGDKVEVFVPLDPHKDADIITAARMGEFRRLKPMAWQLLDYLGGSWPGNGDDVQYYVARRLGCRKPDTRWAIFKTIPNLNKVAKTLADMARPAYVEGWTVDRQELLEALLQVPLDDLETEAMEIAEEFYNGTDTGVVSAAHHLVVDVEKMKATEITAEDVERDRLAELASQTMAQVFPTIKIQMRGPGETRPFSGEQLSLL